MTGWKKRKIADAQSVAINDTSPERVDEIQKQRHEHEYDWKDLYEKEKRRSAMWIAKYEELAGPAPKAIPMAQPEQEPVAEIQMEDMGRPFNAIRVTTHFFKEVPPIGTKLYTTPPQRKPLELNEYDAGLLNDFGGGNVGWWWDYIRYELGQAYDFYQGQVEAIHEIKE